MTSSAVAFPYPDDVSAVPGNASVPAPVIPPPFVKESLIVSVLPPLIASVRPVAIVRLLSCGGLPACPTGRQFRKFCRRGRSTNSAYPSRS